MAKFLTPLKNEDLDDSKYSRILEPFRFYSETLAKLNRGKGEAEIPTGFIHDYESVPLFKGTSRRGGVIHDYFCRINCVPVCTKKQAADIYFEVMESRAAEDCKSLFQKFDMWWRRWLKWGVVLVYPSAFYFHKYRVEATYEEMKGEG